jgi:valyl-tRNA synthetase
MSKTKGNVVDPIEVMENFGTDALRFTLLVGSTPGHDTNLDIKKVEANRNFANKIWNAGRFVISTLQNAPTEASNEPEWTLADSWIWAKLKGLLRDTDRLFKSYQYGEAGRQIYEFFWNDFADWYLEIAKIQMNEGNDRAYYTAMTLVRVMDACLRLLHPFTPYVTEELWGYLKQAALDKGYKPFNSMSPWEDMLIVARWPEAGVQEGWEEEAISEFSIIQDAVRAIRNIRAEKKVKPGRKIPALISAGNKMDILRNQCSTLAVLASLDKDGLKISRKIKEDTSNHVSIVVSGLEIFLDLAEKVDSAEDAERLEKEVGVITSQIDRLEKLLASDFAAKAPPAVVEKERSKLEEYTETRDKLKAQLS